MACDVFADDASDELVAPVYLERALGLYDAELHLESVPPLRRRRAWCGSDGRIRCLGNLVVDVGDLRHLSFDESLEF